MARFQREAEVLASLNHPNTAAIYGVEDRALVMELVEVDDSLSITIGRAEALVRFRDQPHPSVRNGAERVVLWMLEACLEKEPAEPFRADYAFSQRS